MTKNQKLSFFIATFIWSCLISDLRFHSKVVFCLIKFFIFDNIDSELHSYQRIILELIEKKNTDSVLLHETTRLDVVAIALFNS